MNEERELTIYQTEDGAIELQADFSAENLWASQENLTRIFGKDQSVISRHISKVFEDKEVDEKSNMQKMHISTSDKPVTLYSLDVILAVGYRTNSATAINFRKWATKTLKQHITEGYTINKSILKKKEDLYEKVLTDIQELSQDTTGLGQNDILELIKNFSHTWFSLESFDENNLPQKGMTQKEIKVTAQDLQTHVDILKKELMKKGEATELFAQEKSIDALGGIFGNVMQSFGGEDVYGSLEEKAAHLLYFIVKNHAFNDGNKRTGAFAFVWFLKKNDVENHQRVTPETLTTLTLLIAQSDPKDKERIVGLILLLFR